MSIFGTEDLVKLFEDMGLENQNKILSSSFKKGAKLIISAAKSNLGGSYKKVSASLSDQMVKEYQMLTVGTNKRKGGYLGHIVNSGTKERSYTTKNGDKHKTGRIIANHFFDNAVTSTESAVQDLIYKDILDRFNKLIQKRNKIK